MRRPWRLRQFRLSEPSLNSVPARGDGVGRIASAGDIDQHAGRLPAALSGLARATPTAPIEEAGSIL